MDPKVTLLKAEAALADNDKDTGAAYLDDYDLWRRNGGFEPTMKDGEKGDAMYRRLCSQEGFQW